MSMYKAVCVCVYVWWGEGCKDQAVQGSVGHQIIGHHQSLSHSPGTRDGECVCECVHHKEGERGPGQVCVGGGKGGVNVTRQKRGYSL